MGPLPLNYWPLPMCMCSTFCVLNVCSDSNVELISITISILLETVPANLHAKTNMDFKCSITTV